MTLRVCPALSTPECLTLGSPPRPAGLNSFLQPDLWQQPPGMCLLWPPGPIEKNMFLLASDTRALRPPNQASQKHMVSLTREAELGPQNTTRGACRRREERVYENHLTTCVILSPDSFGRLRGAPGSAKGLTLDFSSGHGPESQAGAPHRARTQQAVCFSKLNKQNLKKRTRKQKIPADEAREEVGSSLACTHGSSASSLRSGQAASVSTPHSLWGSPSLA